ncbi:phosphatidylserine decarboxylase family protein [Flavilitoribacter nigricans]|uniref:Phosphatidylserine decarboxylase proenzyme n=1 Tax=Flavilitoribacter nigricans (strain ATCC 23147 / DSM 23189 / NBRC 102662 / NCIMB 1420 / SS-2) TaxID=1122177 RepID=A0A2D0NFQ7_FLAN2|nr:phosphatidylserine decarboxylase family protein [Flavilitoribacter nigricans]PHN07220.1 phosphatidylserine decarboxylase family protein [Flavilitoribacter nigricans DSM 23189 = NBRC 102662]
MIHKEGYKILISLFVLLTILTVVFAVWVPVVFPFVLVAAIVLFLLVLQFFRNPSRLIDSPDNEKVYAPADGKVVVIEETRENEFFNDQRIQVSIFMSPVNVHVNRNPIGGEVIYSEYHPGKYLVAWHPKSSTENERTTVVIDSGKHQVLFRQIAGAMAKRIKNYLKVGQQVEQGSEMGFISFGSRVDVYLPVDAEIEVSIGDKVQGNRTVLAKLP